MKSVAILTTMAAAVGAQQSLRGDWEQGVEEVGAAHLGVSCCYLGTTAKERRMLPLRWVIGCLGHGRGCARLHGGCNQGVGGCHPSLLGTKL